MRKTVIVVPCYNEADRLDREAFVRFVDAHPEVDFIMVDDGSADETGALLTGMADERPGRIALLTMAQNVGKAEAVRQGTLKAMERDDCDRVGYWDADLATPLDAIPPMAARLIPDGPSMVMGARVRLLGRRVRRSMRRHYLGRVFATCVSMTLNMAVYDTQCGAKLFAVDDRLREVFATAFDSRWIFDVEIIARLQAANRASSAPRDYDEMFVEYPLASWTDVAGSKLTPFHFVVAAFDLLGIARKYGRALRR